ncbi:glycerol-3-phosphate 1-O-acyltransferase PlsY [Pseudodesulfovibrio piezophilus]|uniref:Glycerol-3-phosphate acyltransferase n=1 Tax=Pseudodesulfovibrio piezophilus (strain DSM 21447 / JCM 15486 / C1TLV30) TaxID=1322246 RepID=M1WSS4_PSEP2|nr:glycerol-3-phosphate 1-O-acyltransferase PlsY [Pseudodesulfovibrio piezophilus]CCH50354.1 Glycerol-3-phosphate acyltransferase [Pseudodesulfovibrio piezophilus C1TLV30]
MSVIIWLVIAYVLGSIPFGLFIAKTLCKIDPREDGSKNTGATNVARLCGTKFGVATLVLDLSKGFVPVFMASSWIESDFGLSLILMAAIFGHAFSCFMEFKGGKAVATTIGAFLAISPWGTIFSSLLCLVTIAISGHVSMGSLTLALSLPVFMFLTGNFAFIPAAMIVMLLLFWRHKENIYRLARGEENPWLKPKV